MNAIIARKVRFSCGHRYFNPHWSDEKNMQIFSACYSQHGHGHNYILEAFVSGPINSTTGMVVDLREFDLLLKKIIKPFDHHFLNTDIEYFKYNVPTTENIAYYLFDQINKDLITLNTKIKLTKVTLYENEDLWSSVEASYQ
jgi:6-pyruvoyltetrahydropterin/6-carboxytetrahydropterin synthase